MSRIPNQLSSFEQNIIRAFKNNVRLFLDALDAIKDRRDTDEYATVLRSVGHDIAEANYNGSNVYLEAMNSAEDLPLTDSEKEQLAYIKRNIDYFAHMDFGR